jgi:hypothetical protein
VNLNRQNISYKLNKHQSALIFQADRNKNRICCLQTSKLFNLVTILRDKYFMARFYSIVCTITNQARKLKKTSQFTGKNNVSIVQYHKYINIAHLN